MKSMLNLVMNECYTFGGSAKYIAKISPLFPLDFFFFFLKCHLCYFSLSNINMAISYSVIKRSTLTVTTETNAFWLG